MYYLTYNIVGAIYVVWFNDLWYCGWPTTLYVARIQMLMVRIGDSSSWFLHSAAGQARVVSNSGCSPSHWAGQESLESWQEVHTKYILSTCWHALGTYCARVSYSYVLQCTGTYYIPFASSMYWYIHLPQVCTRYVLGTYFRLKSHTFG